MALEFYASLDCSDEANPINEDSLIFLLMTLTFPVKFGRALIQSVKR
jgi:hypothetical protein